MIFNTELYTGIGLIIFGALWVTYGLKMVISWSDWILDGKEEEEDES